MTFLAFLIPLLLFIAYRGALRVTPSLVEQIERDPETRCRREMGVTR